MDRKAAEALAGRMKDGRRRAGLAGRTVAADHDQPGGRGAEPGADDLAGYDGRGSHRWDHRRRCTDPVSGLAGGLPGQSAADCGHARADQAAARGCRDGRQPPRLPGGGAGDRGDRQPDLRAEQRSAARVRRAADRRCAYCRGAARRRLRPRRVDGVRADAAAVHLLRAIPSGGRHRDAAHRRGSGRLRLLRLPVPAEGPALQPAADRGGAAPFHRHRHSDVDVRHATVAVPAACLAGSARRARLPDRRPAVARPGLRRRRLRGRRPARHRPHRAGHRPGPTS